MLVLADITAHLGVNVLLRVFIPLCIFWVTLPSAFAGTLYRCVGADDVPQYTETKVPGLKCQSVATFTKSEAKASSMSAPPSPASGNAGNEQTQNANMSSAPPANADKEIKFLRMGYSTTYTWVGADDVRHFSSSKPQGVANVQIKRTEYPIFSISSCYACGLTSGVNFGNVKLNLKSYVDEVRRSAQKHNVDEAIVRAIIHAESAFRPHVVSPKNAQGLMQLIPGTAKRFGVRDAFDPAQNIEGGVQYLAFLLKRYKNNLILASAAYNAGEGAVDRYNGVPPYKETKNYVVRVSQLAERYRKAL